MRTTREANKYCKEINSITKKSTAYNESILYAKFGAKIGIKECNRIAKKYSKQAKIKKAKQQKTEFVFIGNTFKSKERAQEKINDLEAKGYKLASKNSKKLTYKL